MTNNSNKVSIIIPCYNAEDYIQECINSILSQDYKNIEIIVIDDGSTDQSVQKLEPFINNIILIQQKNLGACIARNKGLEIATGEFIKFLDADDYLEKGILTFQVEKMTLLDQSSIIFGDLIQKLPNSEKLRKYKQFNHNQMVESLIVTGVLTGLPLHRKQLLTKIGGFDPRFKNGQEWNLHIRLAASGVKFVHTPGVVYYQRIHEGVDRISNQQSVINWQYQVEKRLMTLKSISLLTDLSKPIKNAMAFNLWSLGKRALQLDNKADAKYCFTASRDISRYIENYFSKTSNLFSIILGRTTLEYLTYYRKKFTRLRKNMFKKEKK